MNPVDPLDTLVQFFEHLRPQDLHRVDELYAPQAWFKDPFNEVRGPTAIRGVFEHMFRRLVEPRFTITARVANETAAFLTWDFVFRLRGEARDRCIRGATHLQLDPQGRVLLHRDYWDAAEELYEQLPLLGGLMRWLRQRVRSG